MKKMKAKIKELKKNSYEFGFYKAIKFLIFNVFNKKKYVDYKLKILQKECYDEINSFDNCKTVGDLFSKIEKINVWVCWWQGYDNMPEICKMCFDSLKNNLPSSVVVNLITRENVFNFIDIPDEIISRIDSGDITIALFSDWLRNALLVKFGGFWIDSTIYVSKKIPDEFIRENGFWSIKLRESSIGNLNIGQIISRCQWGSFIQKCPPNGIVNKFVLVCIEKHILKHKFAIDYFTQNLIIRLGYDCNKLIKNQIEEVKYSNPNIYELEKKLNNKFNEEEFKSLMSNTTFFKLNWKKSYNLYDEEGNETFFGHIMKLYKNNNLYRENYL